MWIKRDISNILNENSDAVQIISGPRQCGKSSLLLRLDPEFVEVSLDDPHLRHLANTDPELFLQQFANKKVFIDEAQYAPILFSTIKRKVDLYKRDFDNPRKTLFRLTGSNQILMDRNVIESLAGRASFFEMNTLSIREILASNSTYSVQDILYVGGWPELYVDKNKNIKKYLDDYIHSYIEKDIVFSAGIQKSYEFLQFLKLLSGRVGEILDLARFGNEVSVDSKTIKDWLSILERMHIISLVQPYFTNLSKRIIKSPKVYFIDTGLACRLQGWTSAQPILTSPQQGHLFENLVFSEIYKLNINYQMGLQIFHWRSKDGEEVDFLIQKGMQKNLFLEVKISPLRNPLNLQTYPEIRKVFKDQIPDVMVCHQEGQQILGKNIPIAYLSEFLMTYFS